MTSSLAKRITLLYILRPGPEIKGPEGSSQFLVGGHLPRGEEGACRRQVAGVFPFGFFKKS